jgi:hypothetical protein
MKKKTILFLFFTGYFSFAQNTLETIVKGTEVVLTGISIFKSSKSNVSAKSKDNQLLATVCVKNKLLEKITVKLEGKNPDGTAITKEMVIPNDGKECVFEIPKGIYAYQIILSNAEVYQKGAYKFEEEVTITVKKE